MQELKLSLVTGKVGRDEPFNRLLKSVLEHTTVSWELVVADASPEPFKSTHERIRVIHENPRQNHSKGYNTAFRACLGEFILWLNDDAEVCPGYDTAAIAFMEAHPRIGLGALHYSENDGPFRWNQAWTCGYANFGIFRKSLGEKVGFFDEEISMYGADNSLAIKILMADYGVADIPAARILHHSVKDEIRSENQANRRRDNKILTDKYMPHRNRWQKVYRTHEHHCTAVPWAHGVAPQMVGA